MAKGTHDADTEEEPGLGRSKAGTNGESSAQEEDNDSDEDEEDEEPRLKYASLTRDLKPVYRNGDATSTFLVAGDRMVIGTHNGNIHVLSLPSLASIKVYHAHDASVSSVSISPFPPPLTLNKLGNLAGRNTSDRHASPSPSKVQGRAGSPSARSPQLKPVSSVGSSPIHIATSSIDGHVCVQSLTDPRDVLKRNFGRPVKAVALSPNYRNDRSYLSGGLAGNLVLTSGGRSGTSSTASTSSVASSASGWLGSIGLSANTGKDQVLHSGEGAISTIKYSLSGKWVVWVNEFGIKIMRSNLRLDSAETEFAWKRISHTDHPNRPGWDEMAGIWKAHVEWVDMAGLEIDDQDGVVNGSPVKPTIVSAKRIEKLVVGWAGTIWIINVHSGSDAGKDEREKRIGRAEIVTILRIDCTISGISLYTPSLLLVLAYVTPDDETSTDQKSIRPGVHRRKNALQPEMRIIDIETKEEVSVADQLSMSRYESLSATDYHLGIVPAMQVSNSINPQKGTMEAIGGGIEAIGGGLWDATMYPARMFSGSASVRSDGSPGSSRPPSEANAYLSPMASTANAQSTLTHGMKIFIHSPYDLVVATKPTLADHFAWLDSHSLYEEAWNLLNQHPEAAHGQSQKSPASTPTKVEGSLLEFFEDGESSTADTIFNSQAEKEKRRIGELWVQQLVNARKWSQAGRLCGQVLKTSSSWEHWALIFAQSDRHDDIAPYLPTDPSRRLVPSSIYELMLGHYIARDRPRFGELLECWPPELFDADTIIEAIHDHFRSGETSETSVEDGQTGRDWRILTEGLAKLYLAVGRPRQALGCYIQLQDASTAMGLIASNHLVGAVSDDIPGFILIRVDKSSHKSASLASLSEQTLEPIRLLVSEAHHGIVLPKTVIDQLQQRYGMPNPYLYFYFRALWHGESAPAVDSDKPKTMYARHQAAEERLLVQEGRAIVSDYADAAVILFAEYDRPLLMTFLKASQSYTLEAASKICAQRKYTPELVYLLSKEGRTAQALRLIIDELNDVSQAITFAKEQDDASLWDDLLDYSMNKPRFIRGLLEEVGTAINPLKLVKRIPLGLEVEGLREGLGRMLREYEVQESISGGVAQVLRGEVNSAMNERGKGMRKGIRFEIARSEHSDKETKQTIAKTGLHPHEVKPGHCAGCNEPVNDHDYRTHLLAFPCRHIYHVPCLLRYNKPADYEIPPLYAHFDTTHTLSEIDDVNESRIAGGWDRSVGPKVDHAALLRGMIAELGGCPLEIGREGEG